MRIFLDTADLGEVEKWLKTGILDGITTNPSILKSAGFNKETFKNSDCVVIVTDHSNVDYKFVAKNSRLMVDTRNVLKDIKDRKNIIRI